MAWTKEHVADFTPDWYGPPFIGFLADGTCCISYARADGIHEAIRAPGDTVWTDTVITNPALLFRYHYAARGSTRACVYSTFYDPYFSSHPTTAATFNQGINTGGGWSFSTLRTYPITSWETPNPPYAPYVWYDTILPDGVGVAIAPDGTVGAFVAWENHTDYGATYKAAADLYLDGGGPTTLWEATSATHSELQAYGGDTLVVDSMGVFSAFFWAIDNPSVDALICAGTGGSTVVFSQTDWDWAETSGLALDAADNVYAFYYHQHYSEDWESSTWMGYCAKVGGSPEALNALYSSASGAPKGARLNAVACVSDWSSEVSIDFLTRTSEGVWSTEQVAFGHDAEMAAFVSNPTVLYIAYINDSGVWLARQGGVSGGEWAVW
jgi:hypothetical protein